MEGFTPCTTLGSCSATAAVFAGTSQNRGPANTVSLLSVMGSMALSSVNPFMSEPRSQAALGCFIFIWTLSVFSLLAYCSSVYDVWEKHAFPIGQTDCLGNPLPAALEDERIPQLFLRLASKNLNASSSLRALLDCPLKRRRSAASPCDR